MSSQNLKSKIHRITLSARASTFGGIVTPICLAVFKLMISSNLVGCSTGRSAVFAPLRILSIATATLTCFSLLVARGFECRDKAWDEISVRAQYS